MFSHLLFSFPLLFFLFFSSPLIFFLYLVSRLFLVFVFFHLLNLLSPPLISFFHFVLLLASPLLFLSFNCFLTRSFPSACLLSYFPFISSKLPCVLFSFFSLLSPFIAPPSILSLSSLEFLLSFSVLFFHLTSSFPFTSFLLGLFLFPPFFVHFYYHVMFSCLLLSSALLLSLLHFIFSHSISFCLSFCLVLSFHSLSRPVCVYDTKRDCVYMYVCICV